MKPQGTLSKKVVNKIRSYRENIFNTLKDFIKDVFTINNSPKRLLRLIFIQFGIIIPLIWIAQGIMGYTPDFTQRIWIILYPVPISARWYSLILFGFFFIYQTIKFREKGFLMGLFYYSSYDIFFGGRFTDTTLVLFIMMFSSYFLVRPKVTLLNYTTLIVFFIRGGLQFIPMATLFINNPQIQKPFYEIMWMLLIARGFHPRKKEISKALT